MKLTRTGELWSACSTLISCDQCGAGSNLWQGKQKGLPRFLGGWFFHSGNCYPPWGPWIKLHEVSHPGIFGTSSWGEKEGTGMNSGEFRHASWDDILLNGSLEVQIGELHGRTNPGWWREPSLCCSLRYYKNAVISSSRFDVFFFGQDPSWAEISAPKISKIWKLDWFQCLVVMILFSPFRNFSGTFDVNLRGGIFRQNVAASIRESIWHPIRFLSWHFYTFCTMEVNVFRDHFKPTKNPLWKIGISRLNSHLLTSVTRTAREEVLRHPNSPTTRWFRQRGLRQWDQVFF